MRKQVTRSASIYMKNYIFLCSTSNNDTNFTFWTHRNYILFELEVSKLSKDTTALKSCKSSLLKSLMLPFRSHERSCWWCPRRQRTDPLSRLQSSSTLHCAADGRSRPETGEIRCKKLYIYFLCLICNWCFTNPNNNPAPQISNI